MQKEEGEGKQVKNKKLSTENTKLVFSSVQLLSRVQLFATQ